MNLLLSLAVVLMAIVAQSQPIDPNKFNIQFQFNGVSAELQTLVANAAARWQEVITKGFGSSVTVRAGRRLCNQPAQATDLVVRDVLIYVSVQALDGVRGNLARTGPCAFDNRNNVRLAQMQIDSADIDNLRTAGKLQSLLTHEMGHALGVGTTWDRRNLLQNAIGQGLTLFQGANAGAAQGEVGSSGLPRVETSPVPGVGQIHWSETEYTNELMTPVLSGNRQPLSRLTVRSLADLGYTVDVTKADNFNVNYPNMDASRTLAPTSAAGQPSGGSGAPCVGGPAFDPAGIPNVGNGAGRQFIGGQCLSAADCASGCCALPCGICSGPGAQFQAGKQGCGFGGSPAQQPTTPPPAVPTPPPSRAPTNAANTGNQCVGGPAFDPAGVPNVGNNVGRQFIGGQCLSSRDCASGCCALPCGICSGVGAQFQAGKQGCGFGDRPTVQPTVPPPTPPAVATTAPTNFAPGAVNDAARLAFLQAVGVGNLNNGNLVPLTDPRVIPTRRTRTAAEGCAIVVNGFICADLARNVRCVNGRVAVNAVNPFNQNDLLKACVGGFCGGSATLVQGQNPCVATANQAVQGNANGNEFFIPPPPGSASGRRLRAEEEEKEAEAPRELQTYIDGSSTEQDLNWEEGFSGDDVVEDLEAVDNVETVAKEGAPASSTGAIVGGLIGAFALVGMAAFVVFKRMSNNGEANKSTLRDSQMVAGNPMFDTHPAAAAPVAAYNNSPQYYNNQMQGYYGQNNNNYGGQQQYN